MKNLARVRNAALSITILVVCVPVYSLVSALGFKPFYDLALSADRVVMPQPVVVVMFIWMMGEAVHSVLRLLRVPGEVPGATWNSDYVPDQWVKDAGV